MLLFMFMRAIVFDVPVHLLNVASLSERLPEVSLDLLEHNLAFSSLVRMFMVMLWCLVLEILFNIEIIVSMK